MRTIILLISMKCRIHLDGQDIFVEVDWMKGHKPSRKALELVMLSFYRACRLNIFITLHIDDDCMGGGTSIPHEETISFDTDYDDYKDTYFATEREDIFHYCLFAHFVTSDGDNVGGIHAGGHFTVADAEWTSIEAGSCFMHELGHAIGLHSWNFDGIDSYKYTFEQYPSCMNYNAPDDFYGYSSGPDSSTNYNDWEHLNLGEYL